MDAVVKVTRNDKSLKIDIDTFTPLGEIHAMNAVYLSLLGSSLDLPNISFVMNDVTDEDYKKRIISLESQLKRLKERLPDIDIVLDGAYFNVKG